MNGQRGQLLPGPGKRVVLIFPRPRPTESEQRRLEGALAEIGRGGWQLVAVVDPDQYLDALAMIVDGLAEVVVVTRPEHFPVVQLAADLNAEPREPRIGSPRRPASDHRWRESRSRRPAPVEREEEPPLDRLTHPADDATERTRPVARRPRIIGGAERPQMIRRTA